MNQTRCTVMTAQGRSPRSRWGTRSAHTTQQIRMSLTPRVFKSVNTCIQNFAPSVSSWNHMPSNGNSIAIESDAEREVERAALDCSAHGRSRRGPSGCLEHDRVDVLQRPLGPVADVVHHAVGDARDQVAADVHAVDLLEVRGGCRASDDHASQARGSCRRTPQSGAGACGRSAARSCRHGRGPRRSGRSRAR